MLSAVPIPDPNNKSKRIILSGDVPSPANPPSGCTFHPRCQLYNENKKNNLDNCTLKKPKLIEKSKGHFAACHEV